MKYEWKPSMSVGEKKIDSQHRQLLEQINRLENALEARNIDMGLLRDTNHFLYIYFKEHFAYEEGYMEKVGAKNIIAHKKVHESFTRFYDDFQKELMQKAASKALTSLEVKAMVEKIKKYLAAWLVNHIMKMDREYAREAKKKAGAK